MHPTKVARTQKWRVNLFNTVPDSHLAEFTNFESPPHTNYGMSMHAKKLEIS